MDDCCTNRGLIFLLYSVRLEKREGNNHYEALLAQALQECNDSGLLWAEAVRLENRQGRKTKCMDAMKKCHGDPYVLLAVARYFWSIGQVGKARSWFSKTEKIDHTIGDVWAYYYKFELMHGNEDQQQFVMRKCVQSEPRHGEVWQRISKDITNWQLKTKSLLPIAANSVSAQL